MEVESRFFEIILIFLIVLANAFFVAAEFAIVKVRTTQIQPLAKKKHKRANMAIKIISNLDKYLSATQLGITISSLGLGWVSEPVIAKILQPIFSVFNFSNPQTTITISLILGFIIITFIHVILGELAPKYLAIKYSKSFALSLSLPLNVFYLAFKPFIWLLNNSANLILSVLGIRSVAESEMTHTEEELRLLISEGTKSGAIDKTEQQLIEKIFEFNDKIAREIMVPRNQISAINIDAPRDKIFRTVIEEGYSRLPVYKDTIDNIIGIIYTKDLISAAEHRELITLQDIIRPAMFVPATKRIGDLLKELQRKKGHLAVVVDEHGGVEGLVTIEDIIEEIVGEIQDEYDVEAGAVVPEKSGIYLVNPVISIKEFNSKFNADIPEDTDYQTLGGFLQKVTGHIPDVYERVDYKGMSFIVTKKSGNQILQVRVQKI